MIRRHLLPMTSLVLILPFAGAARGDTSSAPVPDKSGCTLANPVPEGQLRELTTDRPDVTESPFTIDAGHVQFEMDFANCAWDRLDGVRTTEWGVVPVNVRVGVRNNFEAGIFAAPYIHRTRQPRGGPKQTAAGFGDITLRGKWNFLGNDGGGKAFGLIADLKLPTAADGLGNGKVEGDVALPVLLEAGEWEVAMMTEGDARWSDEHGDYRPAWLNTLSVGHKLFGPLDGYVELTSDTGDGPQVMTADAGITWLLDRNTQLDAGANLGVSRTAPDVQVFSGLSRRF